MDHRILISVSQTILDIGSFNGSGDNKGSESTSVWWLWAAITVPLTLVVMASWWLYKKRNDKVRPAPMPKEEEDRIPPTKRGNVPLYEFLVMESTRQCRCQGLKQ